MAKRNLWLLLAAAVVAALAVAGYLEFLRAPEPEAPAVEEAPATMAPAEQPALYDDDRALGSAEAPVTIIEYASLTCPHCATFHRETLPALKTQYIDQGLVRLVYRDFPLNKPALQASLLALCVAPERYFSMIEVLYRSLDEWTAVPDPAVALGQIGRTAGLDQGAIDSCLADESETDRIIARAQEARDRYGVDSTPTFLVNGAKHSGTLSIQQFDTILKAHLP